MDFGAILRRAWNVTWKHKALWLFGFLAALFGGGAASWGSNSGQFSNTFRYNLGRGDINSLNLSVPALFALLAVGILVILLLVAGSIILGNLANGALIGMVDEVERTGTTRARSGWRIGWAKWLRLFGIGLVIGIPVLIIVLLSLAVVAAPILLIVGGAALGTGAGEGAAIVGILLMIGLFLLWLLFMILLGAAVKVVTEMAYRKCVLEGRGVFASIGEGYRLARRHLRDTGLTWLILWGIGLGFNVILIPIVLLALAIVGVPAVLIWLGTQSVLATVLVGVALLLVVIAGLSFIEGVYYVFHSSVWTLAYREIVAREQAAVTPQTTV
jgi:hypothetical protein